MHGPTHRCLHQILVHPLRVYAALRLPARWEHHELDTQVWRPTIHPLTSCNQWRLRNVLAPTFGTSRMIMSSLVWSAWRRDTVSAFWSSVPEFWSSCWQLGTVGPCRRRHFGDKITEPPLVCSTAGSGRSAPHRLFPPYARWWECRWGRIEGWNLRWVLWWLGYSNQNHLVRVKFHKVAYFI